jgi:hypothetical protein
MMTRSNLSVIGSTEVSESERKGRKDILEAISGTIDYKKHREISEIEDGMDK